MTVIIFIIVLAVLIFVHELGHFLAARACGIRVDACALGFGPKLFSWKFPSKHVVTTGDTEYSIRLIPFGGYVKIFGENPDNESLNGPDAHRSFVNKPRWQQVIVLAAGVIFNFIFAWILYVIVFSVGVTGTPAGFEKYSQYFENPRVMVVDVSEGSPAQKAGLHAGDVLSKSVADIQKEIKESQGKPITIQYSHNSDTKSVDITPTTGIAEGKYAIGIAMDDVVNIHLPFGLALIEGVHYTYIMIHDTIFGLASFIGTIFKGTANFADVAGPVGIAGIVGNAAGLGMTFLLMITALISINLGVINLMPFPALDGGRILFVIIESIIRRRISSRFTNTVNTIGFILLMALMVLVTYKDIVKLFK